MTPRIDCGDSSCIFATSRSGMRTNGGCRCLRDLPHDMQRDLRRLFLDMSAEITELRAENEELRRLAWQWCFKAAEYRDHPRYVLNVTPDMIGGEVTCQQDPT